MKADQIVGTCPLPPCTALVRELLVTYLKPTAHVQLDLERKLRTLLTKEKEKAEEEAALAMGLCTGGSIF